MEASYEVFFAVFSVLRKLSFDNLPQKKCSEAAVCRFSEKYVFLKISQYSQKAFRAAILLKRDSNTGFFSCKYCETFL